MKYIRFILCLFMAALVCSCSSSVYDDDDDTTTYGNVQIGDTIPDFEVKMVDGSMVSNLTLQGSNSIVMFFNTNCGDCQFELPQVNSFYSTYGIDGRFKIVCIAREQVYSNEISQFWYENSLILPYSPQTDRKIYHKFAKSTIPRLYFCNKAGKVIAMFDDTNKYEYLNPTTQKIDTVSTTSSHKDGRMASVYDLLAALEYTEKSN